MAEQFLKGWAVDVTVLSAIVGKGDRALIKRVAKRSAAKELRELFEEDEEASLEEILEEIVSGKITEDHATAYRRTLELLGPALGRTITPPEIVLPGRGWQSLGPAWKHWGMPTMTSFWGGAWSKAPELAWPMKKMDCDWPVALSVPRAKLAGLIKELASFDPDAACERGVPKRIPRFSDDWDLEDVVHEAAQVVSGFASWAKHAADAGKDLVILHDGQS